MSHQTECSYEFGPFHVDPIKRLLLRDGRAVAVTAKVFDTLLALIERHGQVLPKDELLDRLWPDTAVEENNLTQQISVLRKVLGERSGEHRYIVTVPGRGYSFVADVREVRDRGSDLILEQRTRSSITIAVEEGDQGGRELTCAGDVKPLPAVASPARRRTRTHFLALGLSVLLFGPLTFLTYRHFADAPHRAAPGAPPKSIAVLPFKSLTPDPGDDFLGAGMSDTLIAKLSNLREITVRPTSSVIKFAGAPQDTLAAGRELGVDSVLEGTVQRAGERVRVTVQLLDVRDGRPLWAESFDERQGDIFAVQDAISEQVARSMLTRLDGEERERLRKHYTGSVEAYEAYLRGRHFWNKRTEEGLHKSVEYFRRAIDLDPNYALAYAGTADAYGVLVNYKLGTQTEEEGVRRARAAAVRALEIDETLAEAHTSLAFIKYHHDGDNAGAEREYLRAIELNPNYATARHWYADFLLMAYRPEEAMAEIRRAQQLDPLSPIINTTLGEHLYFARRYDEAAAQLKKTLETDPDFHLARYLLGLTYEQQGRYGEAISEFHKARALSGNKAPLMVAALGHAYAVSGREHEARQALGELFELDYAAPYDVATVYAGLGERRRAFEWLQRAHKDKVKVGWLLKTDPRWASLRSDPTFQNLLGAV